MSPGEGTSQIPPSQKREEARSRAVAPPKNRAPGPSLTELPRASFGAHGSQARKGVRLTIGGKIRPLDAAKLSERVEFIDAVCGRSDMRPCTRR
jgi:hypothetical protein